MSVTLKFVELRCSDCPFRHKDNGGNFRLGRWQAKGGGTSRRWNRQYWCGGGQQAQCCGSQVSFKKRRISLTMKVCMRNVIELLGIKCGFATEVMQLGEAHESCQITLRLFFEGPQLFIKFFFFNKNLIKNL